MLRLRTRAPEFDLRDVVTGKSTTLSDFASRRVLVVMFLCNHCPYVKHVEEGLTAFLRDYGGLDPTHPRARDVAIVAIASNDAAQHPDDAPDEIAKAARARGWRIPYLHDATQSVAKDYTAACTPDFFVFDAWRELVYRGQFDASRPKSDVPVTGSDLRAAVDAVLAGRAVSEDQKPSLGCNIKWRAGNEPPYFPPTSGGGVVN